MIALGIDIGGTSVKAALLRDDAIVKTTQTAPYARPDREALRAAVGGAVREVLDGAGSIDAVGLCAPGLFDPASRAITLSVNVPGIVGMNLDELIAMSIGAQTRRLPPASIVTDAHAAAFDSWVTARVEGRYLALSLGTGVGGCVLDAGTPLVIVGRSPGHLGQLDVTVPEPGRPTPIGPDGGRGSLEAYLGVPALRERYGTDFGPALLASSASQAPLAALVRALRICHALFRPQSIALLGGIGLLLRPRISDLQTATTDGLTSLARPGWALLPAQHAFHAAAGAARLAVRELL
jgi:glucokinase